MKKKTSLDKLLKSIRQYHSRGLLEPDEFMFLFNNTLLELQITEKVDTEKLESEIRNYLNFIDWFGHISTKITQNFFDWGLHTGILDKDGSKAQYKTHSDEFVNYIITEYIEKRHKKQSTNAMPELHSHQGIKLTDIHEDWHTVTQDNGITLTVETVASSLIEYERSYMNQLASSGTLSALQTIKKLFSGISYTNPSEAIVIQVLEQCTELYLAQYEISSVLLPFHLGDEGISSNIDKIYELYTPGKNQLVRKTHEMISILNQKNAISDTAAAKKTIKELNKPVDDVISKSVIGEWEHPSAADDNFHKAKQKLLSKSTRPQRIPREQKLVEKPIEEDEEARQPKELEAVTSEHQTLQVSKKSADEIEPEPRIEPTSTKELLEHYCKKKISDNEYKIAGDFYLIKEHNQFSLMMSSGHKTIGKGEDAFEEPQYKRVSKTPYFIVAKTEHLQSGDQGVQLVAIDNNQSGGYTYLTLGDADSKKVKTTLRNKGILIDSPKLNADYIDFMYQHMERQMFMSDEVGWVEHKGHFGFVLPGKFGIGINGLEYSGKNPNLLHAIETNGNINEWLTIFDFLDLEKAHPRIAFLLFSALLPLFANFHDTFEGFVINITPDYSESKGSSNGKTTIQQLMLSLQGSIEHWHTNWNKTALNMEEYLYTNVGAYFDDTSKTKMKPPELEDLIYSISDAESRGSSRQSARTRKTVMYSTGEKDFLEHTGKDGVYVRYVDVGIKQNDLGSDDSNKTRKIVDHIKKTVVSNYGFVYPEAIGIFWKNKDAILRRTDEYIDKMAQYGQYDNASRIAKRYAMIAICGEVFIEVMRKLTANPKLYASLNPFKISLDMFLVHDNKLMEKEQKLEVQSENIVTDLLSKFNEDEHHKLYNIGGAEVGFIENGDTYFIRSKEVTKILPQGMTKNRFNSTIDKASIVEMSKNVTRKHINNGKQVRYDIFKKI